MTRLSRRSNYFRVVFLILLLLFSGTLGAEQATVVVTSSVNFSVTNISSSSSGSPSATVNYSAASLTSGHKLQINVMAGAANFTTSLGTAIPANNVSWTISGASGGSGFSGTLSSSSWTQVYVSNSNPVSGNVSLQLRLAAPGSGTDAVPENLVLRWQFVSVP